MISRFINVLNYTLFFTKRERALFYKVMASQLRAGRAEGAAAQAIADDLKISPNITKVATIGSQKETEGEGLVEGLAASNYFPPDEIGILRVAYAKGVMKQAFEDLTNSVSSRPSIVGNAIAPAAYFMFFCGLFLAIGYQGESFFLSIDAEADVKFAENVAYQASKYIHANGVLYLAGLIALLISLARGRAHLQLSLRPMLGFLDKDYRLLFGLEFSDLAMMAYRQGASHQELLSLSAEAFGSAKFKKSSLRAALESHISGTGFEDALLEHGVLFEGHTVLLKAISAGGSAKNYADAFQSISEILTEMLVVRYSLFKFMLQFIFGIFIVLCIATFMSGMISLFQTPS